MKIDGANPRFDRVSLGDLKVSRLGVSDLVEAKFAYVNSKNRQTYGFVTLAQPQMFSDKTKKLLSELARSLEEDAVAVLFHQIKTEEKEEGIHEPTGLSEEGDDDQQL